MKNGRAVVARGKCGEHDGMDDVTRSAGQFQQLFLAGVEKVTIKTQRVGESEIRGTSEACLATINEMKVGLLDTYATPTSAAKSTTETMRVAIDVLASSKSRSPVIR
jgi:hypothetical protein